MSKKPPKKKAFTNTPESDRYMTILLEDIRSKLNLLVLKIHGQMLRWNENRWQQNVERLGQIDKRLYQIEVKLDRANEKVEYNDQALKKVEGL